MPKDKESELEQAKTLIDQFCQTEYGSYADFSNLEKIDIAYTTLERADCWRSLGDGWWQDDEIPCQVSVDLIHCSIKYFVDDKSLKTIQYQNLGNLIQYELENLDFDGLIYELNRHIDEAEQSAYIEETWELTDKAWPIFQKQLHEYHNYDIDLEDIIESLRRDLRRKEKEEKQTQNQDIGKER